MSTVSPILLGFCKTINSTIAKQPLGSGPLIISLGLPVLCETLFKSNENPDLEPWLKDSARKAGYRDKKTARFSTEIFNEATGYIQTVVLSRGKFPAQGEKLDASVVSAFTSLIGEQLKGTQAELEDLTSMQIIACLAPEKQIAFIDRFSESMNTNKPDFKELDCGEPTLGHYFRLWTNSLASK